ncbi:MAG: response regulator [Kiritimatiellaeota bacterium]|nr:response regulator [Kiritimatiellota bacterium]
MIEDDESVRILSQRLLQTLGYQVLLAADHEEAIKICREYKHPLHLVFTDVVMPQMDGHELIRRLREIRQDFKVLYCSGFTEDTISQHGVVNAQVNFIPKPFTLSTLGLKVREVLHAAK